MELDAGTYMSTTMRMRIKDTNKHSRRGKNSYSSRDFGSLLGADMLYKSIVSLSGMHFRRAPLGNQLQGRLEGSKIELAILFHLIEE